MVNDFLVEAPAIHAGVRALWLQHSALAGDGLDKVCMEKGTLQNLCDYAVEKMARVKNKTGSGTLPVLRSGPSGGRSFQDHAR